jgi:guanyl-specific ribonuclease Sa
VAFVGLAGDGLARWFGAAPAAEPRVATAPADAGAKGSTVDATPALASVGDSRRDRQIAEVVAAMDRMGRPPEGVAQGGRRGGQRGLFENAEGRLPRRPRGYYVESDVWPRGPGSRGAERLVFGREGEVYYTRDHYDSFTRLR